jgi:hypothetical protein
MGRAMRRAIRIFQRRQGLPVTGVLDGATGAALQAACGGARSRRQVRVPAPPPMGPPEPASQDGAGPPEPGPADAAPDGGGADAAPEGGGADADTGAAGEPASDGDSELFASEHDDETQQEFLVSDGCQVRIQRHTPAPVSDLARLKHSARAPGVYIIYVDGLPWYVGVAERTIYVRLKERLKAVRDFNIPPSALANRTVGWVSILSGAFPSCSIARRDLRMASGTYQPLKGVYAVLKILEQYFINTLGTAGKGNVLRENVVFAPGGSLTIHEEGKPVINVSGTSLSSGRRR